MSQGLTESNENCVFYDEERNKQFEENERQKETLNDEAEREKETENVDVEDVEEREEETGNAEEEDKDAEREEETENTEEEDEEQESGDTGDDESDEYSASEVVSDIDNDVSEEEEDAQDNSVNEWDAVTDLTPELDACTLNESTFNIPIEDISPAGVDFSDQMSSYYSTLKRGLKWFRKVGMEYLLGMALVNAWITYNVKCDKKVSKKEFTEALMQSLTGKSICADSKYNDV
ncbi:unnamed protein product [Parnassius apollo]|uniref:(apollo) hypothetical protein n=1 Tax=Parnassius apollo TaxID=110799 RepID=A0A8S3YBS2_PARAO|nr:unnamed protein product [Parnassius apollo]